MLRRGIAIAASLGLVLALAATSGRAATTPTFGAPVTAGSVVGGEPELVIDHTNGNMFVDGPNGTPGRSSLYESKDGGATWARINFGPAMSRNPGGGDGAVAARGSNVYFMDLYLASDSISTSLDGGATWVGNPFTTLPASDRQWLALGPRDPATGLDTVYALYNEAPRGHMITRSVSSGLVFETHETAAGGGSPSRLVSDENLFLGFTYTGSNHVFAATSLDGGATWRTAQIATGTQNDITGVALDGNDMYASWVGDDWAVHVAKSEDRGLTWGADRTVSAPNTSNVFTWVDARNGKASVAWYGANAGAIQPDDVPNGTKWYARYSESTDGASSWSPQIDVGFARNDFVCTQGLGCDTTLGGPGHRELGDFLSVAINNAGQAIVAYMKIPGSIKIAKQIS